MQFLRSMDAVDGGLIVVSVLLLAGWLVGALARRLGFPAVVGYALAGVGFGLVDGHLPWVDLQGSARLFGEIGLGILLFDLGRRVDLSWIRRDPTLALTSALEIVATFGACFIGLRLMGMTSMAWVAVVSVIAVSSSPAVVIAIVRDLRAQGQVTERLLWLSGVNSVVAALGATLLMSWLQLEAARGDWWMVLHPAYLIVGSLALAGLMAWGLSTVARLAAAQPAGRLVASLAFVLLTLGLTRWLQLSVPLALMALGLMTHLIDRRQGRRSPEFGDAAKPLIVLFFVFAGTGVAATDFVHYGWLALGFVALRLLAKWLTVGLSARLSGLDYRHTFRLGLALAPMSGISVMLVADLSRFFPELGSELVGVVLAAVIIMEILGPLMTHFALKQAGEAAPEENARD